MGTSDVLKVLKIARAVRECNLRTFKTSRVTINDEMHEQVHTIFYLLYSPQNCSNALLFSCSYSSSFGFSFLLVAHVCQTFNQVCVAFNMFLFFAFSLSCSTMFWFDKANRLSAFFSLWCSNLALPWCFHSNFRIALYYLLMHSPLVNQKQDILLSIY